MSLFDNWGERQTGGVYPGVYQPNVTQPVSDTRQTGGVYPQPNPGNPWGLQTIDDGQRYLIGGQRRNKLYDWFGNEIDPRYNNRNRFDSFASLLGDDGKDAGFAFEKPVGAGENWLEEMKAGMLANNPEWMKAQLRAMYGTDNPEAGAQWLNRPGSANNNLGVGTGILTNWNADTSRPAGTNTGTTTNGGWRYVGNGQWIDPNGVRTFSGPNGQQTPTSPPGNGTNQPGGTTPNLGIGTTPQGLQALLLDQDMLARRLGRIQR